MKKLALTIAIVLGLGMTTFADPNGGGLFHRGDEVGGIREGSDISPLLPIHDQTTNQDATPVGSGIVLLSAHGAAYLVGKKRREE